MKFLLLFIIFLSLVLVGCKGETHSSVLQKCATLGDESIIYARTNYIKLFSKFNPNQFKEPLKKIQNFDYVKHRNVINTYHLAVRKIKTNDTITKALKDSVIELAVFSKNLVDQAYPRAIAHTSSHEPLSNDFFNEINQIVSFDHKIGTFKNKSPSFKQLVKTYQKALNKYRTKFQSELNNKK